MEKLFYNMLQPIYPLLAQQFVDDYGLQSGRCIDIETAPGFIGLEIGKITEMEIFFVEKDEDLLEIARNNFIGKWIENEACFVRTDVHDLLFKDNFADFIVSEGSVWSWEDPSRALNEIYRVLKPGGTAIIGEGFGKYVPATMRKRLIDVNQQRLAKMGEKRPALDEFRAMVEKAGLPGVQIINEPMDAGKWVEIKKNNGF